MSKISGWKSGREVPRRLHDLPGWSLGARSDASAPPSARLSTHAFVGQGVLRPSRRSPSGPAGVTASGGLRVGVDGAGGGAAREARLRPGFAGRKGWIAGQDGLADAGPEGVS